MSSVEDRYIDLYQRGERKPQNHTDIPGSTSEQITICLAINRHDLLHPASVDSVTSYHCRLDQRQRAIVDQHRGWSSR